MIQQDMVPAPPWDSLPAEVRASMTDGVRAARQGATPRDLHAMWMGALRTLGWEQGPVKNPDLKTHPNLVPYEDLSAWQRDKDQMFLFIVTALTNP